MICAQCGEREAIVFIRRSGGTEDGCDIVLCESCARDRGIVAGKGSLDLNFDDLIGSGFDPSLPRAATSLCPSCGRKLADILREGRLGCAACADAFSRELSRYLRAVPDSREEEGALVRAAEAPAEPGPAPDELEALLGEALAKEEYEKAARLRDELAGSKPSSLPSPRPAFPPDFPLPNDSLFRSGGPDDDVVLWSSATLFRCIEGIPFPGSPNAGDRASLNGSSTAPLLERALAIGGWRCRSMPELGPILRRSLAERGLVSRSYAAEDESMLLSSPSAGALALVGEGEHLRLRAMRPGFAALAALSEALSQAESLGRGMDFAHRPRFGWICSRLSSCGLGAELSALVHLPAISASGLRDRLLRALMAEGAVVRGFYSAGEESSGALYEVSVEPSDHASLKSMLRALESAVAMAVQSERRARAEISEREGPALADAEGRAFGIARHGSLLGAEEGANLVSTIRLAAIRGSVKGAEPRMLGSLLLSLGNASLAYAAGLASYPEGAAAESLRSRAVKAELAGAEYTGIEEEGA